MSANHRLKIYRKRWAIIWTENGRTKRYSTGRLASNRAAAENDFAKFLHNLNRPIRQENPTLTAILAAYESDRKVRPRPALASFWGPKQPEHVTKELCRKYLASRLRQGRSVGTVHTELAQLRSALIWAEHEKWIDRAPWVELPQKPEPKNRWLTREEYAALKKGAVAPHVKLFIVLALQTAARTEALLQLTWDRTNEAYLDLNVPGRERTRKGRARIPVNEVIREALTEARKVATCDYVIEYGGEPVKSVKKAFKRAVERAGLTGVSPHTLRHTAATWMAQDGVAMREIAGYLGHTDSRTTERVYAHHHPDHLSNASASLAHTAPVVHMHQFSATKAEHRSRKRRETT